MKSTEYFGYEKIGCRKYPPKMCGDCILRFHHQMLQANLVSHGGWQVITLNPELSSNLSMQKKVQECELEAGKQPVQKLRHELHSGGRTQELHITD
jgi:hypothetical protein